MDWKIIVLKRTAGSNPALSVKETLGRAEYLEFTQSATPVKLSFWKEKFVLYLFLCGEEYFWKNNASLSCFLL